MYNKVNNSQVSVELFTKYIKGLFYPTYFTKLNDSENIQSYFNKVNVFDTVKDGLEETLFKNQLFVKNSHIYNKYKKLIEDSK